MTSVPCRQACRPDVGGVGGHGALGQLDHRDIVGDILDVVVGVLVELLGEDDEAAVLLAVQVVGA